MLYNVYLSGVANSVQLRGIGNNVPEYTSAGEYFYEGTKNLNKPETVFAKDWFVLNNTADLNRKLKEYCVYYEAMEQVMGSIPFCV